MKRKYVLGIDPSGAFNEGKGTTGMCLLSKAKYYRLDRAWEIRAKDFFSAEQYWYEHLRYIERIHKQHPNLVVSFEEYILYAQKAAAQINSHFETSQLIGVIRLYCWQNNIPVFSRPAARAKPRWTDEILVHKGILSEEDVVNGYSPHIKDAIRHAMHCIAFELNKEANNEYRTTHRKSGKATRSSRR